jgi:hypothetical protein
VWSLDWLWATPLERANLAVAAAVAMATLYAAVWTLLSSLVCAVGLSLGERRDPDCADLFLRQRVRSRSHSWHDLRRRTARATVILQRCDAIAFTLYWRPDI